MSPWRAMATLFMPHVSENVTKSDVLVTDYRSPIVDYWSPILEYWSPMLDYRSPIIDHWPPIIEYGEVPETGHTWPFQSTLADLLVYWD